MALAFRRVTSLPLRDFDAAAPDGVLIAVIGENGSGKGRLLRLAAGLERSESGVVERPPHARFIGPNEKLDLSPIPLLALEHSLARLDAFERERAAVAIDRSLAHEQVVRLTQLQRDFIALAAHELRTPASSVYGLAATLARRELPEELQTELRETLLEQAERMSRLVEQLLDMSRLDAASIEVAPELIALGPELDGIIRSSAAGRESDVVVETPGTDKVVADRTVLEHVVGNLITNALRYGEPPVRLVAKQTDTHLRIVVEDSGRGIDPEFVPHLFDRFRRSDRARGKSAGSGLGLAIARSYARAHGGDLLYHPAADGGATFELVLPRTTPPAA
jgi:signal transduction histidine kinase